MKDESKTKAQLINELTALRQEMVKLEKGGSKRKQTEKTLTETSQLLGTILDHTHMLVAYMDPQFNFVRVNRAYAEADEREVSFFPGKNHFDLYPNEENEAIFTRVVETGEPYFATAKSFEYTEHPERGVSYWDWSLIPTKDSDGTIIGLVLTVVKVPERKGAEGRLEKEFTAVTSVTSDMLRGEIDDKETEKRVLDACLAVTDSVYGMIGVINKEGKYDTTTYNSTALRDCAFPEALAWEVSTGMTIRGIWGWPMLHGEPLLCNDLPAHPDSVGFPEGHAPLQCYLGVPLKRDGGVVGMVAVANKPGGFTEEDKATLIRLASIISVSRQHREALAALQGRTKELRAMVNTMAGREVRMAELKDVIKKLHKQLDAAGMTPVADDPLAAVEIEAEGDSLSDEQ